MILLNLMYHLLKLFTVVGKFTYLGSTVRDDDVIINYPKSMVLLKNWGEIVGEIITVSKVKAH